MKEAVRNIKFVYYANQKLHMIVFINLVNLSSFPASLLSLFKTPSS